MNVLLVISGIDPASGGPTRSCKGLCRSLAQAGMNVSLLVLEGRHLFENPCGVKVQYAQDAVFLTCISQIRRYDVVHIQGLWNPKLHAVIRVCRKAGVPYIISPRGMLDPWALSVKKWKKRLAMFLYQRDDLGQAAAFHATADLEAANIRAQGLHQPIFIAANGVEVPDVLPVAHVKGAGELRTAIFLSRLHPGKGLLALAEAWARVKPQGWVMRIVGPDSHGHKGEVLEKLDSLGIPHYDTIARTLVPSRSESLPITDSQSLTFTAWEFVDMVDDRAKWIEYRAADLLIHPSVSENFGITIAEGLYAELPVVCTRGTPWKDVETYGCGKWIEVGIEPLVGALSELLSLSADGLHEIGCRGHNLIERKYLWPSVAQKIAKGYEEVLNGGA